MYESWHRVPLMTQADWRLASEIRKRKMATVSATGGVALSRLPGQTITALAVWHSALIYCATLSYWSSQIMHAYLLHGSGRRVG